MAKSFITVHTQGMGPLQVEALVTNIEGLAITKASELDRYLGGYGITHLASGHAVCFCKNLKLAKSVVSELLGLGDWTRGGAELVGDLTFAEKVRGLINEREGVFDVTKKQALDAKGGRL